MTTMALRPLRRKFLRDLAGLAATLALTLPPAPSVRAATTERVVTDWQTGLAVAGFDPVAYFVDGKPVAGRPEYELAFAGVVWRFRNEGNRAAFASDPDTYLPRYGGYDPVAVAHGTATAGHPLLWMISNQQLYLFYSEGNREAFAADPGGITEIAEQNWPGIERGLVP
jgi:YHS domain-containing protein